MQWEIFVWGKKTNERLEMIFERWFCLIRQINFNNNPRFINKTLLLLFIFIKLQSKLFIMDTKKIQSALISVFYKDGLEPVIKKLNELKIGIYSTGGSQKFIEGLGIPVTPVENLTSYPSILGGRVKTLHPKIFGGILGRRELDSDVSQMEQYDIPPLDLVIVDLYPFEETVSKGASDEDIIEKIDIGGISLIRAAAKNYNDVVIISSRKQYAGLLKILDEKKGETSQEERRFFASEAFNISSHYDTAIFNYFNQGKEKVFKQSIQKANVLRYGENPHQQGIFYGDMDAMFDKLNGKELSYNNLLDIDAAVNLINDFGAPKKQSDNEATFAILKHNNACGIATRESSLQAWNDALAGDPVSAFGGIIITNRQIDTATATELNKLFFEVVIAPAYEEKAIEILKQKKNRIILLQKKIELQKKQFRTSLNGVLEQDRDSKSETPADFKTVTITQPTPSEISDLVFANILVKHTKSNTIVLAKNSQLLASGTGQTSRVDALRQAIAKAKSFGFDLKGAVMASDAFFPFPDCVEIAHKEGISAVVQPGGSVKDSESIDYCNKNKVSMVLTGTRHFKH